MKRKRRPLAARKPASLCWYCEKATGGCCWSKYFQPVEGWKARSTVIFHSKSAVGVKSYLVLDCPEFHADMKEEKANRRIRQRFLARGYYDRETKANPPEQRCGTCKNHAGAEGVCTFGPVRRSRNLYQWCYAWEEKACAKSSPVSR